MAMPRTLHARLFYRCAKLRYEDAVVLFKAEHTTGAVYLAGYGIECILKALVLAQVGARGEGRMLSSFRGGSSHEYEWLRSQYLTHGGARFPTDINQRLTLVSTWSTELRYSPRRVPRSEAEEFLASAEAIIQWADGRLGT